jgi:hypothetical protein
MTLLVDRGFTQTELDGTLPAISNTVTSGRRRCRIGLHAGDAETDT